MTTRKIKSDDVEALAKLVEGAKSARLTAAQETEAAGLVKSCLLAGKAGIGHAVEAMVNLPWIVGVNVTVEAWPELKSTARKHFLTGLAAQQSAQGRRFRLSLGRGILPHDKEVSLKLVHDVCAEMLATEGGAPSRPDQQSFFNVLIGKGKPWLLNLPLAEVPAKEADVIAQCAAGVCVFGQCPPPSQLGVIRWVATAGRLAALPEPLIEAIAKSVKRWHGKLQAELVKDVSPLPAPIDEALKKTGEQPSAQQAPAQAQPAEEEGTVRAAPEKKEQERRAPQKEQGGRKQQHPGERKDGRYQQPQPQQQMPRAGFDLNATLRQIESHVKGLRAELEQAKTELSRRREPDRGRDRRKVELPDAASTMDLEELQRHNRQLEETITELRHRLEELASDHEDIAVSMRAHDENRQTDEKEQFKTLLGIKLRPDHIEFEKLAKEPPDEVFREHYRLVLASVFNTLEKHGIKFEGGPLEETESIPS